MTRSPTLWLLFALGAIALLLGCGQGGQTGEETGGGCVETKTALGLDEISPLGFSGQALLDATGSELNAPGSWLPVANLPYGPESGPSSLDLSFGPMRSARFVKSEIAGGQATALETCADRVEVLADATAATERGALDEHFQALLSASTEGDVSLSELFDPAKLSGQFAFDPTALGAKRFTRLSLSGHWFAGSFSARLSAGIEDGSGSGTNSAVSFTDAPLGCFSNPETGARNDCTP